MSVVGEVSVTETVGADQIVLEVGIFLGQAAATGMRLVADLVGTTDPARVPAVAGALPVWDLAVEASVEVAVAAEVVGGSGTRMFEGQELGNDR